MISVLIKFPSQRNLVISLIYIPPSGNKSKALKMLDEDWVYLRLQYGTKIHYATGGDFNIDYSKPKRLIDRKSLNEFEIKNNLSQLITSATRSPLNTKSTTDLNFMSNTNFHFASGVYSYNVNDHDIVYVSLKKTFAPKSNVSFTFWSTMHYNQAILNYRLSNVDWTEFYEDCDPISCWNFLLNTYWKVILPHLLRVVMYSVVMTGLIR